MTGERRRGVCRLGPGILRVLAFVAIAAGTSAASPVDAPKNKAWALLDQALADSNSSKRATATRVLGIITNDLQAVTRARKSLADTSAEVRAAAASALGSMGSKSSIPKLKDMLNDNDISVATAAAQSLITLGDPSGYDLYYAVLTGNRKTKTGLIQEQLNTLHDKKKLAQMGFEQGIGFIPFAGIGYDAFRAVRQNDSSPIRAAAAKMLTKDPDPDTAVALAQAANDGDWNVRVAALDAIAKRGDRRLMPYVSAKMEDDQFEVRCTAAAAVIRLTSAPKPATQAPK